MEKGFTLIELLIVIAILAVLAAGVILVLNPAELLKQSRDATRISDMAALNGAISVWVTDASGQGGWVAATNCTYGTLFPAAGGGSIPCTTVASATVDGSGWAPLDFTKISGGSPLSKLPMDPSNGSTNCGGSLPGCFYGFRSTSTVGQYKLVANMESVKFSQGGSGDVESIDGGTLPDWYELGSALSL